MPLWLIGSAALAAIGYAGKSAGDGIESASNGAVKLAITGVVGFVVLKKMKVI